MEEARRVRQWARRRWPIKFTLVGPVFESQGTDYPELCHVSLKLACSGFSLFTHTLYTHTYTSIQNLNIQLIRCVKTCEYCIRMRIDVYCRVF